MHSAQPGSSQSFKVNSHIHLPPNFSAFDTVEQAVRLAHEQNVRVLGVSNYYDYSVYREFASQAADRSIFPLYGIEIIALLEDLQAAGVKLNDPGNPGKMYVCGKGITRFDPLNDEGGALLNEIRRKDSERMAAMVDRLCALFADAGLDTELDEAQVKQGIRRRHDCRLETVYLQERHVAQAFQEALFKKVEGADRTELLQRLLGATTKAACDDAVEVQNEIRSHLMKAGKAAYVEETFVGFDHAYRLILALGGIPCYPTLADGASAIGEFEASVDDLIHSLTTRGVYAAEFIPIRNTPEVLTRYATTMRRAGLVLTAGTEHNARDLIPLEPTCVGGTPIPEELKELFYEGACVVAAHQARTAAGQEGFVDGQGNLAGDFPTQEERIAMFRQEGARHIRSVVSTV